MSFDVGLLSDPVYKSLADHRCTTKVVDIILQVFRHAANGTYSLNHPTTVCLVLWAVLRQERNVAQAALENMGVELAELQSKLNALLKPSRSGCQVEEDVAHAHPEVSATIWDLVDRARKEATHLNHDYTGTEHLLLATIGMADPSLAAVFTCAGIDHDGTKNSVLELLRS